MPAALDSEAYRVIWLVRRLFRALGQKSNESLEQFGVTAADRAVMEFLHPDQTLSVPEIAKRYQVSRQHVQATVNSLLEMGLVATQDNPRHKRSPLIVLSTRGKRLFGRIVKNDMEIIDTLFAGIPERNLNTTRRTLQNLLDELNRG